MTRGRRRGPDRTAAVVIGLFVALFGGLAAVGLVAGDDDDEPTTTMAAGPADPWATAAERAFAPIADLPRALRALDEWRMGARDGPEVATELDELAASLARIDGALAALGPHPDAEVAAPLHRATAQLYDVAVEVESVAVGLPAGDLAVQVDLVGRRLQVLANRVFDRGRAAVGLGPAAELGPDVIVHRPDEVPFWPAEGFAAAPPLSTQVLASDARPELPPADWPAAARAALPADLGTEEELLASGDTAALVDFADRLEAVVAVLRSTPDEDPGAADRATRVLLGLLLRVEAARTAAAGVLAREPRLVDAASSVLAVASSPALWDDDLGPPPT